MVATTADSCSSFHFSIEPRPPLLAASPRALGQLTSQGFVRHILPLASARKDLRTSKTATKAGTHFASSIVWQFPPRAGFFLLLVFARIFGILLRQPTHGMLRLSSMISHAGHSSPIEVTTDYVQEKATTDQSTTWVHKSGLQWSIIFDWSPLSPADDNAINLCASLRRRKVPSDPVPLFVPEICFSETAYDQSRFGWGGHRC